VATSASKNSAVETIRFMPRLLFIFISD